MADLGTNATQKAALIDLLERLQQRTGCSYTTMAGSIGVEKGVDYSDDIFRGKFRTRLQARTTYEPKEILGIVRALTAGIDRSKRCTAEEALELFDLAGLSRQAALPLETIYSSDELQSALAKYFGVDPYKDSPALYLPPQPSLFVGREKDMKNARERLGLVPGIERQRLTIVRGWPGVGKTTFINQIANTTMIQDEFPDGTLWTSIGRNGSVFEALRKWGRQLGFYDIQNKTTVPEVVEALRQVLLRKKMLLVVDDIWTEADGQPFINLMGSDVSLVLTTRFTDIANMLAITPRDVYLLPTLSLEESLGLLKLIAPNSTRKYVEKMDMLVTALEGLPLALRVAGRLIEQEEELQLDVPQLIERLSNQYDLIKNMAPADRMDERSGTTVPIEMIFQSSVETLQPEAQQAFIFLGAFAPKPATFSLDAMKEVWDVDNPVPLVRVLVGRGLLEPVDEQRYQMHYTLSMYARSILDGTGEDEDVN